jgi:hypothetical protein
VPCGKIISLKGLGHEIDLKEFDETIGLMKGRGRFLYFSEAPTIFNQN